MPEYYIKMDGSNEAQGPFTVDDLKTLVEGGRINKNTPHFWDDVSGWQPIEQNVTLMTELWAPKHKLSLKKPVAAPTAAKPVAKKPSLTVEQMLESAKGNTQATKHITNKKQWQERTAALALPLLGLVHVVMGALMLIVHWSNFAILLDKQDWSALLIAPGLIISFILIILGVALLLSVTAVYPLARYTALALIGYLGVHGWTYLYEGLAAGWGLLAAGLGFGLGVYFTTLTLSFGVFVFSIVAAFGGALAYGWVYLF